MKNICKNFVYKKRLSSLRKKVRLVVVRDTPSLRSVDSVWIICVALQEWKRFACVLCFGGAFRNVLFQFFAPACALSCNDRMGAISAVLARRLHLECAVFDLLVYFVRFQVAFDATLFVKVLFERFSAIFAYYYFWHLNLEDVYLIFIPFIWLVNKFI